MSQTQDAYTHALGLARGGQIAEALRCLEEAQATVAGEARPLALMGTLLTMSDRPAEALTFFTQSLALDASRHAIHSDMGIALARLDRPAEAIDAFSRALAIKPDYVIALNNRSGQWLELEEKQKALDDADAALALSPRLVEAHRHRSRALQLLGRPEDALRSLDTAVALAPDDAENLYRRAFLRLLRHDFRGGWADYEHRWRAKDFLKHSRNLDMEGLPRRDVRNTLDDVAGKRVLVFSEQGVGDHIMFASALSDLGASAAHVTCASGRRMQPLFEHSFPNIESIASPKGLDLSAFDRMIPLGSLPALYRNEREDFPGTPYMAPRPSVAAAWRTRLGSKTTRLRVGISWRGGLEISKGAARSLTLDALGPLLRRSDCEFVSLQYGDVQAEVEAANKALPRPIRLFPRAEIDDFEQLAGLVQGLDLVVSVQTAVIHLAGAIGAPCLVMIPFVAEWRYGNEGSTMPWYNSVRLFRQTRKGAWGPVIEAIGVELDRRAAEVSN